MAGLPAFSLTAVGDIMLGDSSICVGFGFHSRYPGYSARSAFAPLGSRLIGADVVFGNLECSLTAAGLGSTRWRRDQMRGDPEYATVLRELGFTVLGVANNHATQHGQAAFHETVDHLRQAGILVVGVRGSGPWTSEPAIVNLPQGGKVGLLGYCWRPRQYGKEEPPFAEGSLPQVLEDISRLQATVDAVVVSLHWGEEFVTTPSETEAAAAGAMMEAGALAVLGHHPHVVRPCERMGKGLVAYSLGNFTTDMLWQDQLRSGVILDCRWSGALEHAELTQTVIDQDYRPIPGATRAVTPATVTPLPENRYQKEIATGLSIQRRAAYRYAATQLYRYPPGVLGELAWTTARNKVSALGQAFRKGDQ